MFYILNIKWRDDKGCLWMLLMLQLHDQHLRLNFLWRTRFATHNLKISDLKLLILGNYIHFPYFSHNLTRLRLACSGVWCLISLVLRRRVCLCTSVCVDAVPGLIFTKMLLAPKHCPDHWSWLIQHNVRLTDIQFTQVYVVLVKCVVLCFAELSC